MPEPIKQQKTSAQLKKEKREREIADAKKVGKEINRLFNIIKSRFVSIERSGEIPDEDELKAYRKRLQYISAGVRKIRRARVEAPLGQGHINQQLSKITKWMSGDAGKPKADGSKSAKGLELSEILERVRHATSPGEGPVQELIKIMRAAARSRMMSGETLLVAKRARRLMQENRRSEAETERYLNDKIVVPILSLVIDNLTNELAKAQIILNLDVKNYIETTIIGGKSRQEYIRLLMMG